MNKLTILTLSLIGLTCVFSSCKKERTCECTTTTISRQTNKTNGNTITTADTDSEKYTMKATKKEMRRSLMLTCVSSTDVQNSSSSNYDYEITRDITCTLK